jgi:hypothetical protein
VIPARVLLKEPTILESLSMMFHIHNVREDWTEFAISLTIKRIIDDMGKEMKRMSSYDIKDLSTITSLSEYKVRKYLKFHDYPDEVVQMFLSSEVSNDYRNGPDPDILLEMHRPIQEMKVFLPQIFKRFSIKEMIDVCITKKNEEVIRNNKEFRLISQAFTALRKGEVNEERLERSLVNFFTYTKYTPTTLFHETAENFYQYKLVIKTSESLIKVFSDLDFDSLDKRQRDDFRRLYEQLRELFKEKTD